MATEVIRYKPGGELRWLANGSDVIRKGAAQRAQGVIRREGQRTFTKDVKDMAGALFGAGQAAMADLVHRQASATQYAFEDDSFEVLSPTAGKRVRYDEFKRIEMEGDKVTILLEKGSIQIKPFAHLVSGRIKVPIGWLRNGVEVPYELLVEELSARSGLEVEFK
ncbi:MAG: hypothetical protein J0L72_11975 [Armatimonadetes bacterium]|nr:hypothetical protein [Armatimonadota bacterium]